MTVCYYQNLNIILTSIRPEIEKASNFLLCFLDYKNVTDIYFLKI